MSTNQSLKPITTEWKENLTIGGCDLVELANKYGTPLYVIDEVTLRQICRDYKEAFKNERVGYSTAQAIILLLIIMGISIVQLSIMKKKELQY